MTRVFPAKAAWSEGLAWLRVRVAPSSVSRSPVSLMGERMKNGEIVGRKRTESSGKREKKRKINKTRLVPLYPIAVDIIIFEGTGR